MSFANFGIAFLFATIWVTPTLAYQASANENEKLSFMVGIWETTHTAPSRQGEPTVIKGEANIEWVVGSAWLRHQFQGEFPGRGTVFTTHMINYSTPKKQYNFTMFDHFGGDAGVFYGDWMNERTLVVTASFKEEDGTTSYQKFTVTRVSKDEIHFDRAFSDDGNHYHFEVKGIYNRKNN